MRLKTTFDNAMEYEIARDNNGISLRISDIIIPLAKAAPVGLLLLSLAYAYSQSDFHNSMGSVEPKSSSSALHLQ